MAKKISFYSRLGYTYTMKDLIFDTNQLPEVTAAGHFAISTSWRHRDRQVPVHTLIFVIEGTLFVREDGQNYEVAKEHCIIFKAMGKQEGSKYIQPGTRWLWVNFEPMMDAGADDGKGLMALPKIHKPYNPHELRHQLDQIVHHFNSHDPLRTQKMNSSLYQVLLAAIEGQYVHHEGAKEQGTAPLVKVVLMGQVYTGFDKDAISHTLKASYGHVSRCFKAETGMTIKRCYMVFQINEAIALMQEPDRQIGEISDQLNFPNPYYFSRVFKQITGVSPRTYRKQVY